MVLLTLLLINSHFSGESGPAVPRVPEEKPLGISGI